MKHIIIFTIFIFFSHLSFTQEATLNLEWTQTEYLNYSGVDAPQVLVDDVGNTFVCANTYSPGPVVGFITLKYDSLGNLLWRQTYDDNTIDVLVDAEVLSDGSIVVAGTIEYPNTDGRVRLFRYNTEGDTLWSLTHKIEEGLHSSMNDIIVDEEDNIYIVGRNAHEDTGIGHLTLTKINSAGQLIWDNWYNSDNNINGYVGVTGRLLADKIVIAGKTIGDGAYIIHQVDYEGETISSTLQNHTGIFMSSMWVDNEGSTYIGHEGGEYKISKIGLNGDTLWTYIKPPIFDFPNLFEGSLTSATFDVDNNIYISGHFYVEDTRADCLTTKLDAEGNVLWEKVFRLTDEFLNDAPEALYVDENYVYLAARCVDMLDNPENYNYVLVVYTLDGEEVTHITYDNKQTDWIQSMVVKDNYIYITGNTYNDFPDPIHALTQKYRLDISSALPTLTQTTAQFNLYPNPTQDKILVDIEATNNTTFIPTTVQIYNAAGHLVKIGSLSASVDTVDLKDLAEGLYVVHVLAGKESLGVEKLVIVR